MFPGWWLGEADGRYLEPYVSPEIWDAELRNAGFAGTDAVVYDGERPYHINANILATSYVPTRHNKDVTLLYKSRITPVMHDIEDTLIDRGFHVEFCNLSQKPSATRDMIALMDLEEPFFGHIDASTFEAFKSFLRNLNSVGLLWVTRSAQFGNENPLFALVFGMARTLRRELSIDFGTFEVDTVRPGVWEALHDVFEKFQRRDKDSDLDPEYEYAWIDGVVKIGRFHWSRIVQQSIKAREDGSAKRLQIGTHGLLSTLFWEEYQRATLVGSQVEIDTRAVGLNFKVTMDPPSFLNIR